MQPRSTCPSDLISHRARSRAETCRRAARAWSLTRVVLDRISEAALQLLVAFHAEASNTHTDISWAEPSSTIHQVFDFMQLGEHVGLSSPQAGA